MAATHRLSARDLNRPLGRRWSLDRLLPNGRSGVGRNLVPPLAAVVSLGGLAYVCSTDFESKQERHAKARPTENRVWCHSNGSGRGGLCDQLSRRSPRSFRSATYTRPRLSPIARRTPASTRPFRSELATRSLTPLLSM